MQNIPWLSKSPFRAAALAGLCLALAGSALAQSAEPVVPVSRQEYDALLKEMRQMKHELAAIKAEQASTPAPAPTISSQAAAQALSQSVDEIKTAAELVNPGTTKFHIAGSASSTFTAGNAAPSNFDATFSPILLWELSDRLFFESEVELELSDTGTDLNLEYAHLNYALNDYLTLGAGKFLNPMNTFVMRYEPKWINKMPDTPLAIYDGILPESNVGFQLEGVLPLGPSRLNFAAYVSNAPRLIADDPSALGQLEYNNFTSQKNDKAVGGRIGFSPFPGLEVGYGAQISKAAANDGTAANPRATVQSVDFNLHRFSPVAKGTFTLLSQYAWVDVGRATYDANGDLGLGPVTFENHREGGYVQLSYRPRGWSDFLDRWELVVRGDRAQAPANAPEAFNEKRVSFGLDYWLSASTVLKTAYELDDRSNNQPNNNAFLLQISTGF